MAFTFACPRTLSFRDCKKARLPMGELLEGNIIPLESVVLATGLLCLSPSRHRLAFASSKAHVGQKRGTSRRPWVSCPGFPIKERFEFRFLSEIQFLAEFLDSLVCGPNLNARGLRYRQNDYRRNQGTTVVSHPPLPKWLYCLRQRVLCILAVHRCKNASSSRTTIGQCCAACALCSKLTRTGLSVVKP